MPEREKNSNSNKPVPMTVFRMSIIAAANAPFNKGMRIILRSWVKPHRISLSAIKVKPILERKMLATTAIDTPSS